MTTTLNIKGKQCGPNSTIPEEITNRLYAKKGTRILIIAEVKSDRTHEGIDGDRAVDGTLENITVVTAANDRVQAQLDEHVRTIQQALNYERALLDGGQELPFDEKDGPAPKVADILQQGKSLVDEDSGGIYDPEADGKEDDVVGDEPGPENDFAADTEDQPDDEPTPEPSGKQPAFSSQ